MGNSINNFHNNLGFKTRAIHVTTENDFETAPLNQPIYQTSTFKLKDFDELEQIFSLQKRGYIYTRGGNPSVNALEKKIASLENGIDSVCFASGMGAISGVLFSLLKSGDTVLAHDTLYGSAHSFIEHFLTRYNIKVIFKDLKDKENLEQIFLNEKITVVYFETPSNPLLDIIDINHIAGLSHKYGAKVVVDNTFLTPYFQNPLDCGADVVLHSMTKYLNGHGDTLGGVAVARDQGYIDFLKFGIMCEIGSPLDPNSAFLIQRGLKTLAIRMEEHQKSSLKVSRFLSAHPKIEKVFYPGLDSFPDKKIVEKQMKGFGGIVSFEVKGNLEKAKKLVESLNIPALAVSLGDCETLVEHPLLMTHRSYLEKPESSTYKKLEKLIRISVGLEDPDDIIQDLENGLSSI